LVRNLWDEHGRGDPERSHRALYARFLRSLGVAEPLKAVRRFRSTRNYVQRMLALCRGSGLAQVMGALCFGVESYTSEQYRRMLEGLQRHRAWEDGDLDFFEVHVQDDPRHYKELLDVLSGLRLVPERTDAVRQGALAAIRLELEFWDGLAAGIPATQVKMAGSRLQARRYTRRVG